MGFPRQNGKDEMKAEKTIRRVITLDELEAVLKDFDYIKPSEILHDIETRGYTFSKGDPKRLNILVSCEPF